MVKLKSQLWQHQRETLDFMSKQPHTWLNAGMGTGKTLTTLAYAVENNLNNILVIAKKAIYGVWKYQVGYHIDGEIDFRTLEGSLSDRVTTIQSPTSAEFRVTVANYETIWRKPINDALRNARYNFVVVDESHKIKSYSASQSIAAWGIGKYAQARLAMTGTPMPNGQQDAFGQMRFVDTSVFGSKWTAFRDRYTEHNALVTNPYVRIIKGNKNEAEFAEKIRPHFRFVDRSIVALPPVNHNIVPIELSNGTMRKYRQFRRDAVAEFNTGTLTAKNVLVKMLRLHQITGGMYAEDRAKIEAVEEIVTGLEKGTRVVIFANFTDELNRLEALMSDLSLSYGVLDGHTNDLDKWQARELQILLVQIASGAEGIDLSSADYAVFYSLNYSLTTFLQAQARLARPNETPIDQRNPINFYYLLAVNTIDTEMYETLIERGETQDRLIRGLSDA